MTNIDDNQSHRKWILSFQSEEHLCRMILNSCSFLKQPLAEWSTEHGYHVLFKFGTNSYNYEHLRSKLPSSEIFIRPNDTKVKNGTPIGYKNLKCVQRYIKNHPQEFEEDEEEKEDIRLTHIKRINTEAINEGVLPRKEGLFLNIGETDSDAQNCSFNTSNGEELNIAVKGDLLKKWVNKIRQGVPLEKIEEEVDKNYSHYRYFLQEKPLLKKELEEQTLINYYREKTIFLLQQGKKFEDLLEENAKNNLSYFVFFEIIKILFDRSQSDQFDHMK